VLQKNSILLFQALVLTKSFEVYRTDSELSLLGSWVKMSSARKILEL